VATAAARFAEVERRLSLLLDVEARWHLEADPRPASWRPPTICRPQPRTERRDHRQPVREDDRKRGVHGYDAGKKINGRKRHLLVDTLGLVIAVVVHPADVQDRDGAKLLLDRLAETWKRLRLIWADGGYAGQLIAWVRSLRKRNPVRVEIVKRSDDVKGFKVLPRRWVVERTFGWLGRQRRLSKDYEYLTETSETMIYVSMIGLMLRRLAKGAF
jgi:transposase